MRDKKKIVIGVLCALVGIMAVGYAALATRLNITGTASIDSTWKVEITNITEGNIVGDATSKETPSYTATTANFSVGLIQPGDSITYDIEISNLGTLKAKVDSINVVMDENDAITYTTTGVEEGDKLGVNEKATLSVTVAYNPEVTSQPTNTAKDITVSINYVQDLGTNAGTDVPSVSYEAYSIGDTVSFAGSNWYVIKDSTSEEDYVTLMKEKVLTNSELGEYAANYTCSGHEGWLGCTTKGQVLMLDKISFYYSDTCHGSGYYGYADYDESGCEGHNDYEGSKVREYLEGTYINTLGTDNLKEVAGYKIRPITLNELQTNLGFSTEMTASWYEADSENTLPWVYDSPYWTMTMSENKMVWNTSNNIMRLEIFNTSGLRPVINLLKSSI